MASVGNVPADNRITLGGSVLPQYTDSDINRQFSLASGALYYNVDRQAVFIYTKERGHMEISLTEEYHFAIVLPTALNLNNVAVASTQTFDAPAGLDWVIGQRIVFQHDQNNRLVGTVSAYDAENGGISFVVDSKTGTGTFAQWSGSFIGDAAIDGRIIVPILATFANFTALNTNTSLTPTVGDLVFVEAAQGIGTVFGVQTPGWLGGTYYPSGYYMYGSTVDPDNNSRWVYTNEAVVDSISTGIGRLVPEGGTAGQILQRTATGYTWITTSIAGAAAGFGTFAASAVDPIDATTLGTPTVSTSGPDTALVVALGIPTGLTGATGGKGDAGDDGDTVSVAVATNTATSYTLTITSTPGDGSAATSFTTPNLRGTDGGDGDDGGLTEVTTLSTTAATDNEIVYLTAVDGTNAIGLYFRTTGQTTWTAVGTGTSSDGLTQSEVDARIQDRAVTIYDSSITYQLGDVVLASAGEYRSRQNDNTSALTLSTAWTFISANIDSNILSNLNSNTTHRGQTNNPHQVSASQAGVGFKATTFTTLLADTVNIKAPGTIAAVSDAVLFNRSTALPRSSAVEANVNSIPFTYIATNNNGSYSLAFPQQPVAVPLKVGDTASFFVIPDGVGLTVGHHTALVQGQQITAANISFGGSSDPIAATLPLTSAQFAAIKATDGVESQIFQGGEALGIPNSQIFLFEASTVPTHTISTFYVYKGTTQVTTATSASDWLDSDIATDIAGISDIQSAQLLAAPKQFNPLETYDLGDQIFYNDKVYAAIVALTPAPFNLVNWEVLGTGSSSSTGLTPAQEILIDDNTVQVFVQTSSYVIGDQIVRNGDLLVATANKASGVAFIAANWAPASAQNLRTIVELHEVRPTEGPLTVIFTLGTETSFGYTSPSADFQLHPTDYDLITVDGTALTVEIAVTNRAHNGVVTIASAIPGLAAGSHALTFQKRTEESFVEVTAAVTEVDGDIHFLGNRFLAPNIPTTDPAVANVLWNDNGVPVLSGTRAPKPSTDAFSLTHQAPDGTQTFRLNINGFRRANDFNDDADVIIDPGENLGNRLLAFSSGTAVGNGDYGQGTGSTADATTGTIDIDTTNLLTLIVNVAGGIIQLDEKEISIESSTGASGFNEIRISGIDPLIDLNIPRTGGAGEIIFIRSELEIETATGHTIVESSNESIGYGIGKHTVDIQTQIGTVTGTGNTTALGPSVPFKEILCTVAQLTAILADPLLRDYTAIYNTTDGNVPSTAMAMASPIPTEEPVTPPTPTTPAPPEPEPAAKSAFTPGFNSDVTVTTVGGEVTLGETLTTIGIVFVAPDSTSNNEPTIQIPVVDDDGATIPRPTAASTGTYTIDGVAPADSQAVITTDGVITLVEGGLSMAWNDLGTSTITINITY